MPKARWGLGDRSGSNEPGCSKTVGSLFAAAMTSSTREPAGSGNPSSSTASVVTRAVKGIGVASRISSSMTRLVVPIEPGADWCAAEG